MDTDTNNKIEKRKAEIREKLGMLPHVNVNNVDNNKSVNVIRPNVNVEQSEKEEKIKFVARDLAEKLDDLKSLNFYLKIARGNKAEFLYQCLSIALSTQREGKIRTTLARYFVGVFKQLTGVYNKN